MGCTQTTYDIPSKYGVDYGFSYSSSGGSRSWNLNFGVVDEEIISVDGGYHFSGTDGEKDEEWTLENVNNNIQETGENPYIMTTIIGKVMDFSDETTSISLSDRECSYSKLENDRLNFLVCTKEGTITNYYRFGGYGGAQTYWNLVEFEFNEEVMSLFD